MKKLFIISLILFQVVCIAQFESLQKVAIETSQFTEFPKSYVFQEGDDLYYFYKVNNKAEINVEKSTDFGETWTSLQTIFFLGFHYNNYESFDIVQKENGKYFIAELKFGGVLVISEYDLESNSLTQIGTELDVAGNKVELIVINNSTFLVSVVNSQDEVYYFTTSDAAETWSSQQNYSDISTNTKPIVVTSFNNNLYAAKINEDGNSIDILVSIDNASSWGVIDKIFTNDNPINSLIITTDGTALYLLFNEEIYVDLIEENQTDVSYIVSNDNGNSWSQKNKFADFIGNDYISEVLNVNDDLIITILSGRDNYDRLDTYFGKLLTSVDPAPPVIYSYNIPLKISFETPFPITLFVNDESGISSVTANFNEKDYTLYDDGQHNDSLAGDNIYGGMIDGLSSSFPLDPSDARNVNVNRVLLPINNTGVLADVNSRVSVTLVATVYDNAQNNKIVKKNVQIEELSGSLGRYDGKGFLFSGGFYLSGYQNENLWANAVATASLVKDYLPGNVGNSQDSQNLIYTVRETDPPFGQAWQDWRIAVAQGAYFYDGDNDGVYDPVDKNSNGQWDTNEDKPDLLYDGTYFTVYNDAKPAGERRWNNVNPLGIEIRQTIFASNRNTILDDVIFIRYSILYKGLEDPSEPDTLKDVIFSVWNDADIGGTASAAGDDRVGCDTTLQAGYTYNDGEDNDWGVDPPAIFKAIVQGPLVKSNNPTDIGYNKLGPDLGEESYVGYRNGRMGSFIHYIGGDPLLRDPDNAQAARNQMLGKIGYNGEYPDPCNWPYGDVRGGIDCTSIDTKFWYSGDPVTDYGWIGTATGDQRDLTSTEEFTLVKDQPMDIIVAYVVGRGTDALNSIDRAREITQYVHEEYNRNFSTIVSVDDTPGEVVNEFSLSQNYPNPFNPTSKIKYQIAKLGKVELLVYDILGREITTLVNDIKTPGTYEVTFNASQLASGVYFYRLTSGSFMQTKKMILLR